MAEEQKEEPVQPSSSQGGTEGIDPKLAGLLSYLLSIIGGIVFYAISKDKFVKFHAMQSIITFLGLTVVQWIVGSFSLMLSGLVNILGLVLWILLIYKAAKAEKYKLPVIGDLAEQWSSK